MYLRWGVRKRRSVCGELKLHYMAFNVSFKDKDNFKVLVKSMGLKARYDYRQKWWEVYGKRPPKYKIKALSSVYDFIKEWQTDSPKDSYRQSVYAPQKMHLVT